MNKKVQNGLLLCIYLTRAGKANLPIISENLNIKLPSLQQIANKLTKAGVLKSTKGRDGGYELTGDPLVGDVFLALDPVVVLSTKELMEYNKGEVEHRVLVKMGRIMHDAIRWLHKRKIREICKDHELLEGIMMKSVQMEHGGH